MGRNVEAYVDDMVVKSKKGHSHFEDLRETFATLAEYDLKLNSTKCTFGVKLEKFLRFMTLERGIEENSHKIEIVMKLAKPRYIKDIQRLNRCMAPWEGSCQSFLKDACPSSRH